MKDIEKTRLYGTVRDQYLTIQKVRLMLIKTGTKADIKEVRKLIDLARMEIESMEEPKMFYS